MQTWHSEVRDYELDMQGVVNHANYLNYFEHARHQYLASVGENFAWWHKNGYDLSIIDAHIQYKHPLRSNDTFYITTYFSLASRLRIECKQQLCLSHSQQLIAQLKTLVVCLQQSNRKPVMPAKLIDILQLAGKKVDHA